MEEQNTDIMRMNIKLMWKTWDIRSFMIVSLLIQTFLTFLAPLRKRTSSSLLSFSLWLLYLSADAVALFTIGLISSNSGPKDPKNQDLLSFWAPFLLLHLGGPDTITALALADNELWHRHALSLMTQVAITLYVFWRSISKNYNRLLWLPTLLMFIDGSTKYIERTCALYFASADSFRDALRPKPEAGPNYARFVEEYSSAYNANIPLKIHGEHGPSDHQVGNFGANLDDELGSNEPDDEYRDGDENNAFTILDDRDEIVKKVKTAYYFYNKYKGLLVDAILSLKDKDQSRDFFVEKPPLELANIILTELQIMYDVFYTKVFLVQRKLSYARFVCFLSVIASLLLFSLEDKSNYNSVDVTITFMLLGGAIALDICTFSMFILSDWWIIITFVNDHHKILQSPMKWLFKWTRRARTVEWCPWERCMSSYNLLERCFKDPPSFLDYISIKRVRDIFISYLYTHVNPIDDKLIEFIISELQMKAKSATDGSTTNQVCSARGNLVLQEDYFLISECLLPWTLEIDYDESLLVWHLATDICYRTSDEEPNTQQYRDFSKKLSDYMAYLLLRQEGFMSPVVGISDIRFEDTCAEAKKFFTNKKSYCSSKEIFVNAVDKLICKDGITKCLRNRQVEGDDAQKEFLKEFCSKLLLVKSVVKPIVAKGDKSKSVLFDACRLAKQLAMFKDKQWEITSKVWVELVTYAAIRCMPRSHLGRLNQGGELITLVWLSMAHLGLGERFRQNQGFGWTKLVLEE
ncbi:hypothetical protein RND81_11G067500 [Saponaria officinalis]|uniref:DUF4220 domain-containing protein n=1 Tax=Saponaria officinalis TaxID=3572 RepID=A0AAW1HJ01_SAPOF